MGLKLRGVGEFRKRNPKFGRELQHVTCQLSHLKTRAKRVSAHMCEYLPC